MQILTKGKAAKLFARRAGVSIDRAEQMIDRHASAWETWANEQGITIQTANQTRRAIAGKSAQDIDAALGQSWNSILACQDAIDSALVEDVQRLKPLASAIKDLQSSYMNLCEIKRTRDEFEHSIISRAAVESILDDGLPALKQALQDLFQKIKLSLKPENRAEFDCAYNAALPEYSRRLAGIVDDLNRVLGDAENGKENETDD